MANKKVSDTLEQQRKSRQDFLDLKKMQTGQMAPEPKPSEIAVAPKTFKEKMQNYWFHFKWHTIGAVFTVIVLVVLVSQCASRTDWDMQIMYFTYTPVMDDQTAAIGNYLETISEDINGDGEVHINVINCSMSDSNLNSQYNNSMYVKLQAVIAADPEVMLFITDSNSIGYFENDTLKGIFETEQLPLGDKFYEKTKSTYGMLPEGLQIACRRVDGTTLQKQKNVNTVHDAALKILSNLKES